MAVKGGLRYDIDFTGGTLSRFASSRRPDIGRHPQRRSARIGLGESMIQEFGDPREYIIRLPLTAGRPGGGRTPGPGGPGRGGPGLGKFEIRRIEFVGPQVGRELQLQAIYAVLVGLAGILLYIALRFDLKGGVAAVVAVFHDVIVSLGAMSLTESGVLAARAGGAADDHRLLGQRHHRGLRPAA